jgi:hypothetical protein
MNDNGDQSPARRDMSIYLEAGSNETGHERLSELAKDQCASIRARVAENDAAPFALLMMLADDSDVDVRVALCSNRAMNDELYSCLVMDESETVRFSLAEDANCPIAFLAQLTEDDNPYVRARAVRTIKRLSAAGLAGGYRFNAERLPERKSGDRRRHA